MDFKEAVIEAGATRMRPMFMTTLTTIVAMIPMAAAYGNAGKTMQGLALVDVGGLIVSTAMALLVLPVFYVIMGLLSNVSARGHVTAWLSYMYSVVPAVVVSTRFRPRNSWISSCVRK